jgi:putative endonuclease
LECANGAFYVGSSKDILKRLDDHNAGLGANFTRKNGPCKLVYFEEYSRISDAFQREQQIKGWSRKKKERLILRLRNGKAEI